MTLAFADNAAKFAPVELTHSSTAPMPRCMLRCESTGGRLALRGCGIRPRGLSALGVNEGCGPSTAKASLPRKVTQRIKKHGSLSCMPLKPNKLLSNSAVASGPIGKLFKCNGFLESLRKVGYAAPLSSLSSKCLRDMQASNSFLGTTRSKNST